MIDQGLESDLPEARTLIWTSHAWIRALDLYLCHSQSARPKSARQLLVTLTNALKKAPVETQADLKRNATERFTLCLLDYQDPPKAKASAQLLSYLLTKDVVHIENVLLSFAQGQAEDLAVTKEYKSADMLELLFAWLGNGDFGSTIAQLIAAVLDKLPPGATSDTPIWASPLDRAYSRDSANVDDLRAHIFPMLFKRSFEDFAAFLQSQGLNKLLNTRNQYDDVSERTDELLYAALQTGKELGILLETDASGVSYASPSVLVPLQLISTLLLQRSRPARLTGLSLLINSHSVTRPLSSAALSLAKKGFGIFFADVDADFRSEVFGAFSRLTDRIRAVTALLSRQAAQQTLSNPNPAAPNEVIKCHQDFVKGMLRFLTWELRPSASYQRHISALKCLSIMARSGIDEHVPVEFYSKSAQGDTKWPFRIRVLTNELQRLLMDTLFDPFDDVRATAAAILGHYCSTASASGVLQRAHLVSSLNRAETMMLATGRADHADGVAHLYAICYRRCGAENSNVAGFWPSRQDMLSHLVQNLGQMLTSAKQNLADAVQKYPMHGLLTSLRYVLLQGGVKAGLELQSRLFEYLKEVWEVVKPILCNDAPEGYIPEALEDSPESTKESLSYCWRALKEASLLLSSLISTQSTADDAETLRRMSGLCFTQLAELRHRGAFSTVAQTWQSCCVRCKDLRGPSGSPMLEDWYMSVLDILRNNVTINTRRSAGLPSLLCGILVADKSGGLLSRAFADLEAIARKDVDAVLADEGSLAQVHAMNCLKDVLKNTRLGEQTQHHVPIALQLAADALRSEVWAVRNCGLMLFRAVIDRLLGTNESHFEEDAVLQKRISAEQYPALLTVVLGLLPRPAASAEDSSVRYESVFLALQLLQHTRIPPSQLEETKSAVWALLASPSWHVRDKAARTLASLASLNDLPAQLALILSGDIAPQNMLHGTLLTVKYIMVQARRTSARLNVSTKSSSGDAAGSHEGFFSVIDTLANLYQESPAVVTKAACVDSLRECCAFLSLDTWKEQADDHHQLFFAFADEDLHEHGAAAVYTSLLSQCLYDTAAAPLRQAWARYAAHHIATFKLGTTKEAESFTHALFELAHHDDDAASYFLNSSNWTEMRNGGKGALVIDLCTKMLASGDLSVGLKCVAQRTLLALLTKKSTVTPELRDILLHTAADRRYLSRQDCNQQYVDQLLELQAVSFESISLERDFSKQTAGLTAWADDCIAAVEATGVHTREAAAEALDRFDNTWTMLAMGERLANTFSRLCCAVYDLLNDDDEDIRLLAAGITRRILAKGSMMTGMDYEPIVAGQKLLTLYLSRPGHSTESLATAMSRAYGLSPETAPVSVEDQLAALSHSDTALFAEEKQNLYIDDSQEVRVWSQVVSKLLAKQGTASQNETSASLTSTFVEWISSGLDALARKAENEGDGALGWSSNEDVFALGLRVIHGTEVVLQMKTRGVAVPALETKLFACAKAFESSGVNCLWRWEVERILSEAVVGRLGTMNAGTVSRYQVGA